MCVEKMTTWDKYFFDIVDVVRTKSKDPDTQVGCVIVGPAHEIRTTGYNGFPRGVDDTGGRWQRPTKYFWVEHAERNAVYNAARCGVSLEGCTAYIQIAPCVDCARALIQSGVHVVKVPFENVKSRMDELQARLPTDKFDAWVDDMQKIGSMFAEADVRYSLMGEYEYNG